MEKNLPKIAKTVRKHILKMIFQAGSGHPGGSLSITDILVGIYFGDVVKLNPDNPSWPSRDRVILSAGHICPALYSVLAESDFFPLKELSTFRSLGTKLQGHPHRLSLPGIETSSGPLGQGLSEAVGMALGAKIDKRDWHVYCLMSDGEQDEGQVWEAVMLAAKYRLDNLAVIVDKNGIQIDGTTDMIMPLGDLMSKYLSFGWQAMSINGHSFAQILDALNESKRSLEKPVVIIANTTLGKGVSFMENRWQWHAGGLSKEQLKQALKELE